MGRRGKHMRNADREYGVCWPSFFRYFFRQLGNIVLAPTLAFGVAVFVAALQDLALLNIGSIFRSCLHGDMLLSVLSVYVILVWEYFVVCENDVQPYLNRYLWVIKPLRGIGLILLPILLAVAVMFKYHGDVGSDIAPIFGIVEALGFAVCVILQCVLHPKEYMTTKVGH